MSKIKALAITGFGGVPEASLRAGVEQEPDYLATDMGTVDLGPHYLGSGEGGGATDDDLELMLGARHELGVPLLCGSAGIAGADVHVADVVERVRKIQATNGWSGNVAVIRSEVAKDAVHAALDAGRVRPLGPVPALTHEELDRAVRVVGQIGPEPYIRALEHGADVIVGGRACDTSPYVALPILRGFDTGLAYHMAKIIECVSICAEPGGRDCLVATLEDDHFLLESQSPARRCTPTSVAAHSLYEQPNPYQMLEPGGMLDTSQCVYEAASDRVAKVSGSRWVEAQQYTLKLEGAAVSGHRSFTLAGVRDAAVIANLATIESQVLEGVVAKYGPPVDSYRIRFRRYGSGGVLGASEPDPDFVPQECFLIIDVVAESQALAHAICAQAKQNTMHCGFAGRKSTGGNLAFPFSPEVFDAGTVYHFNVYHVVEIDDPMELVTIEYLSA
jgi:hypothetical protein